MPSPGVKWKEWAILGFQAAAPFDDTELCVQVHKYTMAQFTVYIWEVTALTQNETTEIKINNSCIRMQVPVPQQGTFPGCVKDLIPMDCQVQLSYTTLKGEKTGDAIYIYIYNMKSLKSFLLVAFKLFSSLKIAVSI